MKKIFILILLCSLDLFAQGRLIQNPLRKIPKWVRQEFSSQHLDQKYTIAFRLYPHYLRSDFNGDGRKDVAIQIVEKQSGKSGIAIFHRKKSQSLIYTVTILGAGKSLRGAGDDFKWADVWNEMEKGKGYGISLEKRGATGGIIRWDGKNYVWEKSK